MPNFYPIRKSWFLFLPCIIFLALLVSSCGNTRQITLMQGKFDTAKLSKVQTSDPNIQKGDLLSIIIYSDNPAATALYNQAMISMSSASSGGGGAVPEWAAPIRIWVAVLDRHPAPNRGGKFPFLARLPRR